MAQHVDTVLVRTESEDPGLVFLECLSELIVHVNREFWIKISKYPTIYKRILAEEQCFQKDLTFSYAQKAIFVVLPQMNKYNMVDFHAQLDVHMEQFLNFVNTTINSQKNPNICFLSQPQIENFNMNTQDKQISCHISFSLYVLK